MDVSELFEKTKALFFERQMRGDRRHYPIALKQDAVSLLNHYPVKILSRELDVSAQSLRNWRDNKRKSIKHNKDKAAFVSVTLDEPSIELEPKCLSYLILKLPYNLELIVPGQSTREAVQFINALVKEFATCSI